jgi:hypothetical protein
VQLGERSLRFWLEWDRGTMKLQDLQLKFATYAMYLISREWARSSPYLPMLVCVAPEIGQERLLAKAARECLLRVPSSLGVYTTTTNLLMTQGLLAPIWQRVVLADQQVQSAPPDPRRRRALFVERGIAAEEVINSSAY